MDHHVRRRALAARLGDLDVDALLVSRLVNVRYLTGFTGSNAQVLVTADDAEFMTDGRYGEQSRREVGDLERHTYAQDYRDLLAGRVASAGFGRLGFESDDVTVATHGRLTAALPGVDLVPVTGAVEALRAVKDDEERELIRRPPAHPADRGRRDLRLPLGAGRGVTRPAGVGRPPCRGIAPSASG